MDKPMPQGTYESWTPGEDERLLELAARKPISSIAKSLHRTYSSIHSRLSALRRKSKSGRRLEPSPE
jgi:hypothetical protein